MTRSAFHDFTCRYPALRPFVAGLLLTLLVACSAQHDSAQMAEAGQAADAPAVDVADMAPAASPEAGSSAAKESAADDSSVPGSEVQTPGVTASQLASSANTVTDPRRRFVRTAQASFQVKDVYASVLAIEDAVAAEGGFVVNNTIAAQEGGSHDRPLPDNKRLVLSEVVTRGNLVVRVPSDRTQAFLRVVAKQMEFLDERSFEASDVQFDMLRRELAHARAQLLQQEMRAAAAQPAKTGDKIDAIQAREAMLISRDEATVSQRELEDRVAFSTLTLQLSQPVTVRERVVPDTEAILRDRGPGFFQQVGEALKAGWRGLLEVIVVVIHLWPLWVLLAAAALLIRSVLRWRRASRARRAGHAGTTPAASP